jgi:pilus assembly protein CpaB
MGAVRIVVVIVALVAAVVLALIVGKMVAHKPATQTVTISAPAKLMTQVMVAKRALPIGTRLAVGDLAWQPWPADAINPAFITDGQAPKAEPAPTNPTAVAANSAGKAAQAAATAVIGGGGPMGALYGSIVREPFLINEPINNAKLVRGGEGGFLAVVLRPGMRAIAVPVNVNTDAGGFILPGDRVDVLQAHQSEAPAGGGHPEYVAQTLLRNVRVLAIDQVTQPPKNGATVIGAVATLEVAAADSELLARAKAQGEMVLALRSYADAGGPSGRGVAPVTDTGAVHVFRNGQVTDVMVTQ